MKFQFSKSILNSNISQLTQVKNFDDEHEIEPQELVDIKRVILS